MEMPRPLGMTGGAVVGNSTSVLQAGRRVVNSRALYQCRPVLCSSIIWPL